MKIHLAQINPTVGALESNYELIRRAYEEGSRGGADVVVVPELAVTGYPPRDLLDKRVFIERNLQIRDRLATMTGEVALIFGCVTWNENPGKPFRNTAVVAIGGEILLEQHKTLLPTYDVFDELRYFEPATERRLVELFGTKVGVSICEDYWHEEKVLGRPLYTTDPAADLARQGAELLINISASPFNAGKRVARSEILRRIAATHSTPVVYVNQVGGNDELLFDGSSLVVNGKGKTIYCGPSFETSAALVSLDAAACGDGDELSQEEEIARALMMGLRDYLHKVGFSDVVLGLSGGIDSAVTAALAVRALGAEHVTGIAMPSRFSSQSSLDDARDLSRNLRIDCHVIPIDTVFERYLESFREMFGDGPFGLTEENVQARIRGNLLMAWSNEKGAMVLSTGNKSELAVGYCTLYGDMSGGLGLLGDVYKMMVYRIARWINREGEVIPESSIVKPPSAELRHDQTDQDSLPPYDELDGILRLYIEEWLEIDEIAAAGFDRAVVEKVIRLVDGNEFKRRQAAPTLRVSSKAFGSGRQMPIAQRWRSEGGG
jgi:NAD+ synthase (glutamine-hydrolysing)